MVISLYGANQITKNEFVNFAQKLGATIPKQAMDADIIFTSEKNYSRYMKGHYIRTYEGEDGKEVEDQYLASLRLFFALIISKEDVEEKNYQFNKKNTSKKEIEKRKIKCKCEIDPLYDGRKGLAPFLISLKKNLNILLANDLILADNIYKEVSNKYEQSVDSLHTWKGFLLHFFQSLCGIRRLKKGETSIKENRICDLEDIMKRANLFYHHTKIHQFSGRELRQILFAGTEFIKVRDEKKGKETCLEDTIELLQELCAISYFTQEYQQCKFIQMRLWVLVYKLPYYLEELFGKSERKNLWSNYLHDIMCHLPQLFEKGPLPDFSTERFESETSQKDKNNTNNNTFDFLEVWMSCYPSKKEIKITYLNKYLHYHQFIEEHHWKPITVKESQKTKIQFQALLKILKPRYTENVHYTIALENGLSTLSFINSKILK